jgi:putative tryptophan/tyrosine transport system substrate-binding protein
MRRPGLLLSLAAAGIVAWQLPLHAQKPAGLVIGFLTTAAPSSRGGEQVVAFHSGLRESGFVEGENVRIEYRWAKDDYALLREMAKELVALPVSVIVAAGGHVSALAAHDATKEIPIAFTTVTDPVKDGLVKSLNRPGGNATGTAGLTSELDPKRLELLHDAKPTVAVVGVLVNPNRPGLESQSRELQAAAEKLNLKLEFQKAATPREIESAFQAFASLRVDALLVAADPLFNNRRAQVLSLAASQSLPARIREGRRPDELRPEHHRGLSSGRDQRRAHAQGHQTRGYPGRAAHAIPAGHQPDYCEAAWPRPLPGAALARRRGDRVAGRST